MPWGLTMYEVGALVIASWQYRVRPTRIVQDHHGNAPQDGVSLD